MTTVLNQDPRLRAMIMPLFRFDPRLPDGRPFGLGTTFRIDPWGTCATAFHVIEDMLLYSGKELVLRDEIRMVALELEGIAYGAAPLPEQAWRPLSAFYAEAGGQTPTLFHEKPRVRNLTELARLTISRSHQKNKMPCLPVALRKLPVVGEIVMGYGFANLDVAKDGAPEDRPISQYLYESAGEVIEVLPADPSSSMPWPCFRVAAEWPSGMSGGPVVDRDGSVIGVISRSWTGERDSTATHFAGWNIAERVFPSIDGFAPRRYRGFAALDDDDDVRFLGPNKEAADAFAHDHGMTMRAVSCNLETGDWIAL